MEAAMTLDELLKLNRVELQNVRPGRHYTTCPQCSPKRKLAHQKNKCLGVTIEGDRARWGCNHCGWTGPSSYGGNGARSPLAAHLYRDRHGNVRFRKVRNLPGGQPRFWLEHWDEDTGWLKGAGGADTSILYRIDEVAEAIEQGRVIAVVEGEKDADNLWKLDIPATCNAHGASEIEKKSKWTAKHSEQLSAADIVVLNDNDAAGFAHAKAVCAQSIGIAKRVRRLDLKNDWPEMANGQDVSDWLDIGGEHTAERLKVLIKGAPDYADAETPDDDAELARLARLPPLEYGRARRAAAEALGDIPVNLLDAAVKAKRAELGLNAEDDGKQGQAISFPEPDPWPEPVDGAKLLDDIAKAIRLHVVMPDHACDTTAHEPRAFATYAACAIAMIGRLPGTLADRSVTNDLVRRKADEAIEPFRFDRVEHLTVLARKLMRWARDNAEVIAVTDPRMPAGLYNRAADNWRGLLSIATVAGGDWLARGHKAALAGAGPDDAQLELLLGDIRDTLGKQIEVPSADMVNALVALEGHPWAELGRSGKPLTQNRLARMLKPLRIAPTMIGPETDRKRGYKIADFSDAFDRYLGPAPDSQHAQTPPKGGSQP
jgi:Protein of unknown function (DUF3631)